MDDSVRKPIKLIKARVAARVAERTLQSQRAIANALIAHRVHRGCLIWLLSILPARLLRVSIIRSRRTRRTL